ncbi:single-stranded DNA-binding protein [Gemmatimonas sp.]
MSRSLNKVMLIGNVGGVPEVKTVGNGTRVAALSLATSRSWTNEHGQKQEKVEWHRLIVWNGARGTGLADVVEKHVAKGDRIYVEGELEYRQWQDKEGQTRYTTEIKVKELMLLGGRAGGSDERPARAAAAEPTTLPKASSRSAREDLNDFPGALADDDDDLPF